MLDDIVCRKEINTCAVLQSGYMRTYNGTGELDVDELEKGWGVEGRVDETCVVHGRGWR
jgi:hypothetical protein